jgi:hypothetical protein
MYLTDMVRLRRGNRYSLRADTELLLQVPATRRSFGDPFPQQGPLYGIGCHNPSGLPITFHHSKASLKHYLFFECYGNITDVKRP